MVQPKKKPMADKRATQTTKQATSSSSNTKGSAASTAHPNPTNTQKGKPAPSQKRR